jgi:hypothetical protein
VALTDDVSTTPLSPRTIYHISIEADSHTCDKGSKCGLGRRFQWHRPNETCQFNFVCSRLDGNVCGSYGVRVTTGAGGDGSGVTDICRVGEHLKTDLNGGDEVDVGYWFTERAETAACYFWCTADGALPQADYVDRVDPTVIEALVSKYQKKYLRRLAKWLFLDDWK